MQLWNRKSGLERVLETVNDSLDDLSGGVKSGLPSVGAGRAVKTGLIAAGGLAGLTAASAGISSLRRRVEATTDES